jgi:acetyltransferase
MISLGGMADVDFGDMLDYLGTDHHTRGSRRSRTRRKFMSASRAAAQWCHV